MADADTGYGSAVTVYHTVQYFEEAGVVGINIEDRVSPKRCGHMRGKELIDPREMAKKIEAAVKGRKDADFIINARTDAIAAEGLDRAIERAKLYIAAGADMVFPDAVEEIAELMGYAKIGELESDLLLDDQLDRKYGSAAPDYVIRPRSH